MMRRAPLVLAAIFAALWAASGGALAQFRSGVNLVVVQVTVTDANGRVVTGLSRDTFSVFEDNGTRPIEQFSAGRSPVSLGILVDVSGSMEGRRFAEAQRAIGKLLERFDTDDQMFLAVFNNTFRLITPWTNDHAALMRPLSGVTPAGGTYLYTSVSTALPLLNAGSNRKKALVIISDGDDNEKMAGMNRELLGRAVQQARQSEALIYVIGIGVPRPPLDQWFSLPPETRLKFFYDPPVDVDMLRRLTDPTGGYTQLVASTDDLSSTVISIADDLSAQYTIGFESKYSDGRFHALKVTTGDPSNRVRAKTGYVNP